MPKIYLDYQSATPVRPEVIEVMRPFFDERFGNAAALNRTGLQARDALKAARETIARFINAPSPDDVLFTSDGTEAMNLALKGVAWANRERGTRIISSAIEHPGVMRSIEFLKSQGFTHATVPVDKNGRIDPDAIREVIDEETILIATHLANHDLGTIQKVAQIGSIARGAGVPLFVDAEAAAGWMPINIRELGADLLSLSPQRFYGPKGVGVLYRSGRVPMTPLIHGGAQEHGFRAGIENIGTIVGGAKAVELVPGKDVSTRVADLQASLWEQLNELIPNLHINGPAPDGGQTRAINTLNISCLGTEGEGIALAADMRGLAISSGPACHGKALKISPTLAAIGVSEELAKSNILLSLGEQTTPDEITEAVNILEKVIERLRSLDA